MLLLNKQNNLLGKLVNKMNDPNVKVNAEAMGKIFDQVNELGVAKNNLSKADVDIKRMKEMLSSLEESMKLISQNQPANNSFKMR